MDRFLFRQIDNSPLIVFRMIFGLLIMFESFGAIATGWIRRILIEPKFTFSFIDFEWVQPLPGNGMYVYYSIMGVMGFLIMIGYKYRLSMLTFTIMWAGVYFMQKTSYNNHYYLLILLSAIMFFQPANKYLSVDAKLKPEIKSISMPYWCTFVFILQMFIVYTYASIAKLYPDWLDTSVVELLMRGKKDYAVIGELLQEKWVHWFIAYGGILFDGLIIPLLLWKPTRKWAFFISIFFHLFNSFVFQIGIFPYLSMAFALFFFETKTIHSLFLKRWKPFYNGNDVLIPSYRNVFVSVFVVYFIIQIGLPLRHWFFKDDVLWTEEGHRLSWRMMLRSKSGHTVYKVVDAKTDETIFFKMSDYLSEKQQRTASAKPDAIWQFAQYLKQVYAKQGREVKVYVDSKVRVNGRELQQFTDPTVDLANTEWHPFKHSEWILPSKLDKNEEREKMEQARKNLKTKK